MKELKFRAWIKPLKRYATRIEIGFAPDQGLGYFSAWGINGEKIKKYHNHDLIIEPYTGRTDKNQKGIYEGDICLVYMYGHSVYAQVLFGEHYVSSEGGYSGNRVTGFYLAYKGGSVLHDYYLDDDDLPVRMGDTYDLSSNNYSSIEVVGNIHENMELFEGGGK